MVKRWNGLQGDTSQGEVSRYDSERGVGEEGDDGRGKGKDGIRSV